MNNVAAIVGSLGVAALVLGLPAPAAAHCDTLRGPVVASARQALATGQLQPVLKWIPPTEEAEAGRAFEQALQVRSAGGPARQLADRFFFETIVRLHRAGEGMPFTGLKEEPPDPVAEEADLALEQGSIDELAKRVGDMVAAGVRQRYSRAAAARRGAEQSVANGRAFVEAYVEYLHYIERVHLAGGKGEHQPEP